MTEPSITPPRRDALLTSARLLVTIIMVLIGLICVGLTAAVIAAPIFHDELLAKMAEHAGHAPSGPVMLAIVACLVLLLAICAIGFVWLRLLRRIIDSVGSGEPFAAINAERLSRMGWLTVAIEAVSVPAGAIAGYLTHLSHRQHVDIGLSLGGVLMALILFILARVFREGAAMREELEGTV